MVLFFFSNWNCLFSDRLKHSQFVGNFITLKNGGFTFFAFSGKTQKTTPRNNLNVASTNIGSKKCKKKGNPFLELLMTCCSLILHVFKD